ncbi:7792_t:CDS:2 [Ambispora gerdemannii]|uniref:Ubiquitin-like protein ATG12 n=1 Tax=Ambispora gerdemannii TaxID=144530 RepID=A0A9N8V0B3_9GLOM|nr:7792_t:CDS:2 [Ambispora gerdemannii]
MSVQLSDHTDPSPPPSSINANSSLGSSAAAAASSSESNQTIPVPATSFERYKRRDMSKVVVRFRAIGNAPILKQNFYKITASNQFKAVIQFLRRELNYKASDPLFLYINSAFSPAPDEIVSNLHKCFNTDGHLIINYCTSAAWG